MATISLIAAVANNGVIGSGNQLPWRLRTDLRHFKEATMGKPLIMGRKTYESIGRALNGRRTVVLTRDPKWKPDAPINVVHSFNEAMATATIPSHRSKSRRMPPEVMVCGGAEIYAQFLPVAKRLYLTWVHAEVEGDAVFPQFDPSEFREMSRQTYPTSDYDEYSFTRLILQRDA